MIAFRIAAALEPATIAPARSTERLPDRDAARLHRHRSALPARRRALSAAHRRRVGARLSGAKLDVKLVIEADDRETAQALARLTCRASSRSSSPPRAFPKPSRAPSTSPCRSPGAVHGRLRRRGRARSAPVASRRRRLCSRPARRRLPAGRASSSTTPTTPAHAFLHGRVRRALRRDELPRWRLRHARAARRHVQPFPHRHPARPPRLGRLERDRGRRSRHPPRAAGYRVGDLPSTTLEEAPATVRAWMEQRTRWMKGYMQTCITHGRRPAQALRALGFPRFMGAVTMTFGALLAALGYPFFVVHAIVSFANGTLMRAGTRSRRSSGGGIDPVRRRAFRDDGPCGGGDPAQKAAAVSRLRAASAPLLCPGQHRGLARPRELLLDPFRWNKTEHGLARTSAPGAGLARQMSRLNCLRALLRRRRSRLKEPTNRPVLSMR